jgi:hypothetical protein
LFILRSSPMSARIIYMKAPGRIAVEQMHDPHVPAAMAQAYLQLVYCIAAWHDWEAGRSAQGEKIDGDSPQARFAGRP